MSADVAAVLEADESLPALALRGEFKTGDTLHDCY